MTEHRPDTVAGGDLGEKAAEMNPLVPIGCHADKSACGILGALSGSCGWAHNPSTLGTFCCGMRLLRWRLDFCCLPRLPLGLSFIKLQVPQCPPCDCLPLRSRLAWGPFAEKHTVEVLRSGYFPLAGIPLISPLGVWLRVPAVHPALVTGPAPGHLCGTHR